ncbi:MAG: PAS domain S-box protein [Nitrospirae bacterium]|nr:PAS domain S-box protein [Nitrospirota bacterium]
MKDEEKAKGNQSSDDILAELNAHHEALIYTIPDIVYFKDIQGRNMVVNKAFEEFVDLKKSEIVGKTDDEIFPHDLAIYCRLSDMEVMKTRKPLRIEEEATSKDGKKTYFDTMKSPLFDNHGNLIGVAGVSRDITERRHHEEQLWLFRTLINQSNDAIFIDDPETGRFLDVNDKACSSLGYSRYELLKMGVVDIEANMPDHFSWEAHLKEVKEQKSMVLEGRLKRRDGTTFPVEVNVRYITQGKDSYMVAVVRDITERKQETERYTAIIRSAMDAFWMIDHECRFLDVNDAACTLLGYSREELLGMRVSDVEAVETREDVFDHIRCVKETGGDHFETRHRRKDGSIIDVDVSARFIDIKGGQCYVFIRDITERKRREERKIARLIEDERFKTQRLESLGVLAGGIAHDFNNILTAILGNISIATQFLNPSDKAYKHLSEAEKAIFLAQGLTRQLLTFSKGGAPLKTTLPIALVVRESAEFALRGMNVRCDFVIPEEIKPVEADEGQIRQVIHNLVINALHAMPQGGVITIRCENMTVGTKAPLPLKEGDYIRVSVEDSGIGIPEEHLSRIFDPYFTTKQTGSGLGLPTSYSIIKRHDGLITVNSRLGTGTIFHIYLPASDKEIVSVSSDEKVPVSGRGRILVMDDEEMIRTLAGKILGHLGYQVALAVNGQEAIEQYQKARGSGKPFDLLIMDLTIPGAMGGKEAIERLLQIDPGVRTIVSSGYSDDPILANYRTYGFKGVIKKPYRLTELSHIVHEVISRK